MRRSRPRSARTTFSLPPGAGASANCNRRARRGPGAAPRPGRPRSPVGWGPRRAARDPQNRDATSGPPQRHRTGFALIVSSSGHGSYREARSTRAIASAGSCPSEVRPSGRSSPAPPELFRRTQRERFRPHHWNTRFSPAPIHASRGRSPSDSAFRPAFHSPPPGPRPAPAQKTLGPTRNSEICDDIGHR